MSGNPQANSTGTSIENEDPIVIAKRAERDLARDEMKQGHGSTDSALESGVNQGVEQKFPGASVQYGSEASGAGDNRAIPEEEGGYTNPQTGRQTKAADFEGVGGPEDKAEIAAQIRGGDPDASANTDR